MPTWRRIFSIALTSSVSSTPSTLGAFLMLLEPVDAADQRSICGPDGPQITIFSPVGPKADVAQHVKLLPYHFDLSNTMIGWLFMTFARQEFFHSPHLLRFQRFSNPQAVARHREAEREVDQRMTLALDLVWPQSASEFSARPTRARQFIRLTCTSDVSLKIAMSCS